MTHRLSTVTLNWATISKITISKMISWISLMQQQLLLCRLNTSRVHFTQIFVPRELLCSDVVYVTALLPFLDAFSPPGLVGSRHSNWNFPSVTPSVSPGWSWVTQCPEQMHVCLLFILELLSTVQSDIWSAGGWPGTGLTSIKSTSRLSLVSFVRCINSYCDVLFLTWHADFTMWRCMFDILHACTQTWTKLLLSFR